VIYLQEHVKDVGLRAPFDLLIPLVEFSFETALCRGHGGQASGAINPGMIWSVRYFQVGAEAVVPINSRSGTNVGFIAHLHFYVDDLFPHAIGRPLFGRNMAMKWLRIIGVALLLTATSIEQIHAHAFVDHAEPL
jgi:hypothetical protein